MINITFPDGSIKQYEAGVTAMQVAESISPRLAAEVLSCGVNGETRDLLRPINEDCELKLYKWDDEEGKHFRRSVGSDRGDGGRVSRSERQRRIHRFKRAAHGD